jgi:hypothetical protein
MKIKNLVSVISIALLAATLTSYSMHQESRQSLQYRFADDGAIEADLEKAVQEFNRLFATFYDTGGDTQSLNEFPATNLVKRRVFQDIDTWKKSDKWYIHDLHKHEFLRVGILSPGRAFVETRELWHLWERDTETSEKSNYKINPIKVRYYLGIERGRWTVLEYEVYGLEDEFPELTTEWGVAR